MKIFFLLELPFGWKEIIEKNGNVFYIEYVFIYFQIEIIHFLIFSEQNKRCTTEDPRHAFPKDPSTNDSSNNYGHQSNALQILYGKDLSNKTAIVTGANTGIGRYLI